MDRNICVYPGTFDPVTKGHLDIIDRGLNLFDDLIVAVAESPLKRPLFSVEERVQMIEGELMGRDHVSVESFDGLLINYIEGKNSRTILRGLRVMSDFEYEFQMALTNRKLSNKIETVFMMTKEDYASISSRFIKEIARLGGNVSDFVTPNVAQTLINKYKGKGKNDD